MRARHIIAAAGFVLAGAFGALASPAAATEQPAFRQSEKAEFLDKLDAYLTGEEKVLAAREGVYVADAYLNTDSRAEYIARIGDEARCLKIMGCRFVVLGNDDDRDQFRQLAKFNALRMEIADTMTEGVRDLLVYRDPWNDFSRLKYSWNSKISMYQPWSLSSRARHEQNN